MIGACGWGCTGFFVNKLSQIGLSPMQIAAIRVGSGAGIFFVYVLLTKRVAFSFALKDIGLFVGTGVLSLSLFTWSNFNAISLSSMSVASVLLYTSPVFVLILAAVLFKEKVTPRKVGAVVCTFAGCFLVSGVLESGEAVVAPKAVMFGVGSGLAYALYTIFARLALAKYSYETVIVYTFILSTSVLLPQSKLWEQLPVLMNNYTWLFCLAFGLISTVLPYLLYTKGLKHVEASKAAVLATCEPIVATIIGISVFHDAITPLKFLGIAMIIAAVLSLSLSSPRRLVKT